MGFDIGVMGTHHHRAPLSLREAIVRAVERQEFGRPVVLLATCNRVELYFQGECEPEWRELFQGQEYTLAGRSALRHLCEVTAGLDSALLGETEIQRQVKLAYLRAGALPSVLHFAFQKALKVGKEVRTRLPELPRRNLGSAMLALVRAQWDNWRERRVMLVGNSAVNRGLIALFTRQGITNVVLVTRSVGVELGCRVVGREALGLWREFDWVVLASKGDEVLLRDEGGPLRTSLVFDLSVPRLADPELGSRLSLWNVEALEASLGRGCEGSAIRARGLQLIEDALGRLLLSYQRRYESRREEHVDALLVGEERR